MAGHRQRMKKRLKRLKIGKNHPVLSVFVFMILFTLTACIAAMFVGTFVLFQVDSRLSSEVQTVYLLSRFYDECEDTEKGYELLDSSNMDYIVTDGNGNIIRSRGSDTRSDRTGLYYGTFDISDSDTLHSVYLYEDSEKPVIRPHDDDNIQIDVPGYAQELAQGLKNLKETDEPHDDADDDTQDYKLFKLPVWTGIDARNKGEIIYYKCMVTAEMSDVAFIITLFAAICILLTMIIVILIANLIRGAANQRKMRNLLFTDLVLGSHNKLWYFIRGDVMLTGLGSARKNYAAVDLEFVGYKRFCVCHSSEDGENALKSIYSVLSSKIGKKELCCHSSEDSFALLLEYKDEEELKHRIEKLISSITHVKEDHKIAFHGGAFLMPSIPGSGRFSRRMDADIETAYNNASAAAASLADRDGSGYTFFDDKFIEEQRWEDTVSDIQQQALENEEFVVYYQPKYDPRTNELRGAEALIRWQSPQYGFVTPYKFIPIFEKNGFITEIDHYMISHVARDQKRWLDEGQKCVPVSVNVSRAHFIESDLAEQIRDMVDKYGAPHELIEIELTESAFFDDKKAMINTIRRLKEYGFAVSMDDFGSGYSSLNSLKDMPLDVLKLDAGFFRGEEATTERGEIVVSEAIKLAKSLDMRTVAEGVEAKEQVDFLAHLGCDMIQGYYYAKPMPADDYRERLITGRSQGGDIADAV